MNWFGRTLVRATIWQGLSEARYQAHQQQRRQRVHYPVPHQQAGNREVKVSYACPQGHGWVMTFTNENSPTERELSGQRCPECRGPGHWLALDYHRENDQ